MSVYTGEQTVEPRHRGGVVAIGNFDGVHLGHQHVIKTACARARANGVPAGVVTFDPHPRRFFQPDAAIFALTSPEQKFREIQALGVDFIQVLTFDAALAGETAETFVQGRLVDALQVRHVVVGFNFHFGKKRGGNPDVLTSLGGQLGFGVDVVAPAKDDSVVYSSSAVRDALRSGQVERAADLLGRYWSVRGEVISGAHIGTGLGFPTANIALDPSQDLGHGIYAVFVTVDGATHEGAAYFGKRPTFDNGRPVLEVFLLDFNGDLYGREIEIAFVGFVRADKAFDTGTDLAAQMNKDVAAARAMLAQAARDRVEATEMRG